MAFQSMELVRSPYAFCLRILGKVQHPKTRKVHLVYDNIVAIKPSQLTQSNRLERFYILLEAFRNP